MKLKDFVLVIFNCFFFTTLFAQSEKTPFQYLDVFELEHASDPQISPDGSQIVYVRNGMDIMKDKRTGNLWIVNSDGSNHRKLTSSEGRESNPRWSPDGGRIAYTASTAEGSEIYIRWMDTGQTARISQLERSPRGISWSPDGKWLAFSMLVPEKEPVIFKAPGKPKGAKWAEDAKVITRVKHEADGSGYMEPGYAQLFVVPAEGGTPRQVTSGDYQHRSAPQWSPDGKSLIFSSNRSETWDYEFYNSEIYSVSLNDGTVKALTNRDGPDRSPAISPDGRQIAYLSYENRTQTYQVTDLYLMNSDGSGKKSLTTDFDRSVSSPTWAADGSGIYFQYDDKGNTKIGFMSLGGKMKKVADNIGGTVIGRPYGGGSFSVSSNNTIVFTHTEPDHPADIAVLSSDGNLKIISDLNGDLLAYRNLAEVEEVWWKSSYDQRDIQGWIATPPNYDPSKKYPLLLENHGGPISNYGDRFSPEIQLYAAAGYVVFYPNPRGSTSYGEEFGNLLHHNYPGNDYDDIMSGIDHLIEKGIVDGDSLYVTGGSAGGIMTAWIIGKNNRFNAAVVAKPVMNWYSKVLTADNYYGYFDRRYPGQPWENPEIYMKFSPISLVGNVETPTMVLVGTDDLRTPLSEAKQLYHALKLRKIETALVQIPGASHNIVNRPSQLISKVGHVLEWFEKYR